MSVKAASSKQVTNSSDSSSLRGAGGTASSGGPAASQKGVSGAVVPSAANPSSTTPPGDGNAAAVRCLVYCRLRPTKRGELNKEEGSYMLLNLTKKCVKVHDDKSYEFDGTFDGDSRQEDVFEQVAKPCLDNALHGFRSALMCYGQTGTGKSFTMCNTKQNEEGIIPRSAQYIFDYIAQHPERNFSVHGQFIQIYRDNLGDLMTESGQEKVDIRFEVEEGVTLPGCSEHTLTSVQTFMSLYNEGNKRRVTTATAMNPESSRGHSALLVWISSKPSEEVPSTAVGATAEDTAAGSPQGEIRGKITFIDLAGYERFSKTGISNSNPIMKDEARTINASLLSLGHVVSALSAGDKHIPWRNSKLTRLLQDSIGGRSRTTIILTVGPSSEHLHETTNTLQFGQRAMAVKVEAKISTIIDFEKLATKLQEMLQAREEKISMLEVQLTTKQAEREQSDARNRRELECMRQRHQSELEKLLEEGATAERIKQLLRCNAVEEENFRDQMAEEVDYREEEYHRDTMAIVDELNSQQKLRTGEIKVKAHEEVVVLRRRLLEAESGSAQVDQARAMAEKDETLMARAAEIAALREFTLELQQQLSQAGVEPPCFEPLLATSGVSSVVDGSLVLQLKKRHETELAAKDTLLAELQRQVDTLTDSLGKRTQELQTALTALEDSNATNLIGTFTSSGLEGAGIDETATATVPPSLLQTMDSLTMPGASVSGTFGTYLREELGDGKSGTRTSPESTPPPSHPLTTTTTTATTNEPASTSPSTSLSPAPPPVVPPLSLQAVSVAVASAAPMSACSTVRSTMLGYVPKLNVVDRDVYESERLRWHGEITSRDTMIASLQEQVEELMASMKRPGAGRGTEAGGGLTARTGGPAVSSIHSTDSLMDDEDTTEDPTGRKKGTTHTLLASCSIPGTTGQTGTDAPAVSMTTTMMMEEQQQKLAQLNALVETLTAMTQSKKNKKKEGKKETESEHGAETRVDDEEEDLNQGRGRSGQHKEEGTEEAGEAASWSSTERDALHFLLQSKNQLIQHQERILAQEHESMASNHNELRHLHGLVSTLRKSLAEARRKLNLPQTDITLSARSTAPERIHKSLVETVFLDYVSALRSQVHHLHEHLSAVVSQQHAAGDTHVLVPTDSFEALNERIHVLEHELLLVITRCSVLMDAVTSLEEQVDLYGGEAILTEDQKQARQGSFDGAVQHIETPEMLRARKELEEKLIQQEKETARVQALVRSLSDQRSQDQKRLQELEEEQKKLEQDRKAYVPAAEVQRLQAELETYQIRMQDLLGKEEMDHAVLKQLQDEVETQKQAQESYRNEMERLRQIVRETTKDLMDAQARQFQEHGDSEGIGGLRAAFGTAGSFSSPSGVLEREHSGGGFLSRLFHK